uniref:peptidyl-tRNA hydrolase n=1 Tax=Steinernema glaseri TaxID=37863 RepID=A0A1I7ZEU8_9BILA
MMDRALAKKKKAAQLPDPVEPKHPRVKSFKMIFVVNAKLKMEAQTVSVQLGVATEGCHQAARRSAQGAAALDCWGQEGSKKVVLQAKDTEHLVALDKAAGKRRGLCTCLVQVDEHTKLKSGSTTVLGLFGEAEQVEAVTKDLKLLWPL